jgi:hypothetical protein
MIISEKSGEREVHLALPLNLFYLTKNREVKKPFRAEP